MERNVERTAARIFTVIFFSMCIAALVWAVVKPTATAPTVTNAETLTTMTCVVSEPIDISETEPSTVRTITEKQYSLTTKEIELIALVTMAEAEAEPELGKRLVIDTILNRVDDKRFPNTVNGVVYQRNAFEAMWNGRVDRCEVRDDIVQLVKEELESRTNHHVIFFRTEYYSKYGTPMFSVGRHYFSEY